MGDQHTGLRMIIADIALIVSLIVAASAGGTAIVRGAQGYCVEAVEKGQT